MGSGGNEPTEVSLLIPSGAAGSSSAASSSAHSHGSRHYHGIFKKRNATEKIFQKDKELAEKLDQQQPKLGTFGGVFLPTALNVLSILMFLRFGFIVGQLGIAGSFVTLMLCYTINLLTTLSVSAIATNGVVRTGGAYYMISRSLGPEFGGAIGLIFYFGQILNSALNVVGLIEPLLNNFGTDKGTIWAILPESYTWSIVYSTIILFLCVSVSLVGADMVSRAALLLFIILMISILSVPVSALFVSPFDLPSLDTFYSGISWQTFKENLLPQFTKHAAGSQINGRENFANLFGIFFPATAGILAGASMSGSLANPSKSIPKGTLWGLLLTFFGYGIVILSLGVSVPRDLLHKDVQVIQTVSFAQVIIILGEFSTSVFSIIMGVVGAADILSAISKDVIIPGLSIFANKHSNPVKAILFSWLLIQAFLFANINQIATLITMAFLMTFIVINVACFLLEISAAPNFRPSFDYFNRATAAAGVVACLIAMFIVDGISASMIIFCLLFLIITIHYVCPPKSWGDVSQTLIYHQVRKYLFKLRQDNVKYWRPQILLLVDNPRTCWNLMHFCNHLKKGGLYILGHVIISTNDFEEKFDEYTRERTAWIKLRDMLNLKAFVQFSFSASLPWGVRNIFLGSGLGSMKPNIIVIGFLDLSNSKSLTNSLNSLESQSQPPYTDPSVVPRSIERLNPAYSQQVGSDFLRLPTDHYRGEKRIKVQEWVQCIEELLLMKANVAVAKGFPRLCIPDKHVEELDHDEKAIIDLYPIQMSAEIAEKSGQTILSTNFDTYTLILQLGAILTTVPQWNKTHRLRIVVFVEEIEDVEEERERLTQLIGVLRINAEILVLCFNSGDFSFYDYIAKNKCVDKKVNRKVNKVLANNEWWKAVTALRLENLQQQQQQQQQHNYYNDILSSTLPLNLRNTIRAKNNNITLSRLQRLGVSLKMRTSRLLNEHISGSSPRYDFSDSDSNDSDSDLESVGGYESDPEAAIRKQISKPKTLASERRMRRKTFSNVLNFGSAGAGVGSGNDGNDNITGPKTPKSPFFDKHRVVSQQQQPKSQQQQQQQQQQQEQQASSKNGSDDITSETLKRPTLSRQNSKQSYTSLRNQARPNFSSQAMPKSKVNEEATGLEPSIMFAAEDDNVSIRSKSRASSIKGIGGGGSKRIVGLNKTNNIDGVKEKSSLFNSGGGSGNDFDCGSAFDKDDKSANKYKYAAAAAEAARAATGAGADAGTGAVKRFDVIFNNSDEDKDNSKGNNNNNSSKKISTKTRKSGKSTQQGTNGIVEAIDHDNAISSDTDDGNDESDAENVGDSDADTDTDTDSEGREFNVENLSFNDLPARAQHLILNQLMMKTSKNSSIIFTTLPTPPVGCHKNINDSVDYVETLELWCRGLPPVILINSRTMTVTTAL